MELAASSTKKHLYLIFVGDEGLDHYEDYFKHSTFFQALVFVDGTCYKHIWEAACYILFPKCDSVTKQVKHPCREMCRDFLEGCWKKMKDLLARMGSEFREKHGTWYVDFLPSVDKLKVVNCDYLPSRQGSIPCFYKTVTCDSPPDVTNGTRILNTTQKDVYQLHDVVHYACVNEGFEIIGNSFITCMYSGQWSQSPPKCTDQRNNSSINVLYIVLPILILPLIVLLTTLIIFKVKSKTIDVLSRTREFDVFFCYKFDTDNGYVVNVILKHLEVMCEPPLKLCVHERDFIPGLHIKDNINNAITKSNSAIIVMSQAFIDSDWCQNFS